MRILDILLLFMIITNVILSEDAEAMAQPQGIQEYINKNQSAIENDTHVNSKNVSGNLKITTSEILTMEQAIAERQTTESINILTTLEEINEYASPVGINSAGFVQNVYRNSTSVVGDYETDTSDAETISTTQLIENIVELQPTEEVTEDENLNISDVAEIAETTENFFKITSSTAESFTKNSLAYQNNKSRLKDTAVINNDEFIEITENPEYLINKINSMDLIIQTNNNSFSKEQEYAFVNRPEGLTENPDLLITNTKMSIILEDFTTDNIILGNTNVAQDKYHNLKTTNISETLLLINNENLTNIDNSIISDKETLTTTEIIEPVFLKTDSDISEEQLSTLGKLQNYFDDINKDTTITTDNISGFPFIGNNPVTETMSITMHFLKNIMESDESHTTEPYSFLKEQESALTKEPKVLTEYPNLFITNSETTTNLDKNIITTTDIIVSKVLKTNNEEPNSTIGSLFNSFGYIEKDTTETMEFTTISDIPVTTIIPTTINSLKNIIESEESYTLTGRESIVTSETRNISKILPQQKTVSAIVKSLENVIELDESQNSYNNKFGVLSTADSENITEVHDIQIPNKSREDMVINKWEEGNGYIHHNVKGNNQPNVDNSIIPTERIITFTTNIQIKEDINFSDSHAEKTVPNKVETVTYGLDEETMQRKEETTTENGMVENKGKLDDLKSLFTTEDNNSGSIHMENIGIQKTETTPSSHHITIVEGETTQKYLDYLHQNVNNNDELDVEDTTTEFILTTTANNDYNEKTFMFPLNTKDKQTTGTYKQITEKYESVENNSLEPTTVGITTYYNGDQLDFTTPYSLEKITTKETIDLENPYNILLSPEDFNNMINGKYQIVNEFIEETNNNVTITKENNLVSVTESNILPATLNTIEISSEEKNVTDNYVLVFAHSVYITSSTVSPNEIVEIVTGEEIIQENNLSKQASNELPLIYDTTDKVITTTQEPNSTPMDLNLSIELSEDTDMFNTNESVTSSQLIEESDNDSQKASDELSIIDVTTEVISSTSQEHRNMEDTNKLINIADPSEYSDNSNSDNYYTTSEVSTTDLTTPKINEVNLNAIEENQSDLDNRTEDSLFEDDYSKYSTEISVLEIINGKQTIKSLREYKHSVTNRKLLVSEDADEVKYSNLILSMDTVSDEKEQGSEKTSLSMPSSLTEEEFESLSTVLEIDETVLKEIEESPTEVTILEDLENIEDISAMFNKEINYEDNNLNHTHELDAMFKKINKSSDSKGETEVNSKTESYLKQIVENISDGILENMNRIEDFTNVESITKIPDVTTSVNEYKWKHNIINKENMDKIEEFTDIESSTKFPFQYQTTNEDLQQTTISSDTNEDIALTNNNTTLTTMINLEDDVDVNINIEFTTKTLNHTSEVINFEVTWPTDIPKVEVSPEVISKSFLNDRESVTNKSPITLNSKEINETIPNQINNTHEQKIIDQRTEHFDLVLKEEPTDIKYKTATKLDNISSEIETGNQDQFTTENAELLDFRSVNIIDEKTTEKSSNYDMDYFAGRFFESKNIKSPLHFNDNNSNINTSLQHKKTKVEEFDIRSKAGNHKLYINRSILNTTVKFFVKISKKNITLYVPEDATLKLGHMELNITWKYNKHLNNSLTLFTVEKEGLYIINKVQLVLIKENHMQIEDLGTNIDILDDKLKKISFPSGSKIHISNVAFLKDLFMFDDAGVLAESSISKELIQIEIIVVCIIVIIIIALCAYWILKKHRQKVDANKKNQDATAP